MLSVFIDIFRAPRVYLLPSQPVWMCTTQSGKIPFLVSMKPFFIRGIIGEELHRDGGKFKIEKRRSAPDVRGACGTTCPTSTTPRICIFSARALNLQIGQRRVRTAVHGARLHTATLQRYLFSEWLPHFGNHVLNKPLGENNATISFQASARSQLHWGRIEATRLTR